MRLKSFFPGSVKKVLRHTSPIIQVSKTSVPQRHCMNVSRILIQRDPHRDYMSVSRLAHSRNVYREISGLRGRMWHYMNVFREVNYMNVYRLIVSQRCHLSKGE